jgi:hypothetical protein
VSKNGNSEEKYELLFIMIYDLLINKCVQGCDRMCKEHCSVRGYAGTAPRKKYVKGC